MNHPSEDVVSFWANKLCEPGRSNKIIFGGNRNVILPLDQIQCDPARSRDRLLNFQVCDKHLSIHLRRRVWEREDKDISHHMKHFTEVILPLVCAVKARDGSISRFFVARELADFRASYALPSQKGTERGKN